MQLDAEAVDAFHRGVIVGGVEVVHWLVNGFEDPCFYIEISQNRLYKIKYAYVLPRGSGDS